MVAMFMGNEDRMDVFRQQTCFAQSKRQLPDAQSTVNQHSQRRQAAGFNQR